MSMKRKTQETHCKSHPTDTLMPGLKMKLLEEENLIFVTSHLHCTQCEEMPWKGSYLFPAIKDVLVWGRKYSGYE
jgi:hypothetical protein